MERAQYCLICNKPFHRRLLDDYDRGVCYAEKCKLKYMKQNIGVTKEEIAFVKKLISKS